jgi:[acyl-carrier-protein] S-malonyltransferase
MPPLHKEVNIMTTRVAFLFPGQGSQAVGMGADIFAASSAARHVFETVDEALGFPLSTLCFHGPEDTLRATINAQPAIVTVSLAFLAAFQEALSPQTSSWASPLAPGFTAGHSVGECAALLASGALDLKGVALLVRERGRLMHEEELACPGGMAAVIGMDVEILQEVCQEATQRSLAALPSDVTRPGQGQVVVANYNAPGQIVISGEQHALALATTLAKERGAKRVIPLSVSGAFHSPVMQPAALNLARSIEGADIRDVSIPIIGNISAKPLTQAQALRVELAQQVATSVQWTRTIEYLTSVGITTFIEIGPGQALTGMIKRIAKGITTINVGSVAEVEKAAALVREMSLVQNV